MGNKWSNFTNEELLKKLYNVIEIYGDIKSHDFTKYGLPTTHYYSKILNIKTASKYIIYKYAGIDTYKFENIKPHNINENYIITTLPAKTKDTINWNKSVGYNVRIMYKKNEYTVKIVSCDSKNRKITVKYLDNPNFEISVDDFRNGFFGRLLGLDKSKEYNYSVGDVITTNERNLEIIERIRMPHDKYSKRGYMYKCLNCGNTDKIDEYNLRYGKGCNVCCQSPVKIVKEINSVWKTHPEIIKYFKDSRDAEKYSISSNKKIFFICPRCGEIKKSSLNNMEKKITNNEFPCDKCGDNKSYPEKFVFNVLQQSGLNFTTQKTFKWSQKKLYDFYIPSLNCIIETHGLQHYEETNIDRGHGRNLKEEQANDKFKKLIAVENNIQNYIILDCRKSELQHIKSEILNSELAKMIDLLNIDWLKCHEYACNSLVKVACDLWNSGIRSTHEISIILGVYRYGVGKYLKMGKLLGWCDYDAKEVMRDVYKSVSRDNIIRCGKPLICIENGFIFKSTADCENKSVEYFKIKLRRSNVGQACTGRQKSSKGYHFKYLSDLTEEEIIKFDIKIKLHQLYSDEELIKIKTVFNNTTLSNLI